jgi:hypothetical protein
MLPTALLSVLRSNASLEMGNQTCGGPLVALLGTTFLDKMMIFVS